MISKPTVLVLGAGASAPYNFPSGRELLDGVVEALREKPPAARAIRPGYASTEEDLWNRTNGILALLRSMGFDLGHVRSFRTRLRDSGAYSVDAFLEHNANDVALGKVATAHVLLKSEKFSGAQRVDGWYRYLWSQLMVRLDQFDKNRLSVVTYNYDRSIEHFLFGMMKSMFPSEEQVCKEKISSIRFIHLHGSLGPLPWQSEHHAMDYGQDLVGAADRARIEQSMIVIHEGKDDSPEYNEAFELMTAAERIYCLGFGYGETNMTRLALNRLEWRNNRICGTSKGLPEMRQNQIRGFLRAQSVQLWPRECLDFLQEMPLD